MDDYVSKPILPKELVTALRRHLKRSAEREEEIAAEDCGRGEGGKRTENVLETAESRSGRKSRSSIRQTRCATAGDVVFWETLLLFADSNAAKGVSAILPDAGSGNQRSTRRTAQGSRKFFPPRRTGTLDGTGTCRIYGGAIRTG